MKLDTIKEATVSSSIDFEDGNSVDMKISEEGMAHIMSVLTQLYKDPELATMREYFTNGLDAHIAIGQTKPVEVLLPTQDSPIYVVKDFGVGMSRDDMFKIYSQYGASTKRGSNEQSGAFGLGAKAALNIATQFTVVSIKDGVKITALVSKAESGINTLSILSEVPTDSHSGTVISIPIPDIRLFNEKADRFFSFVDPAKFKLFGKDVKYRFSNHYELPISNGATALVTKDNTHSYGWGYRNDISIVMGSVGYEVDISVLSNTHYSTFRSTLAEQIFRRGVGISANIGDVDLTPSREGLRYTEKTKKFIETALVETIRATIERFKKELDALEDFEEISKFVRSNSHLGESLKKWRGTLVDDYQKFNVSHKSIQRDRFSPKSAHNFMSGVQINRTNVVFVTGYDPLDSRKVFRGLRPWFEEYNNATKDPLSSVEFVLVDKIPAELLDNFWVKQFKLTFKQVTAQTIIDIGTEAARKSREASKGSSKGGTPVKVTYPVLKIDRTGSDNHSVELVEVDKMPAKIAYLSRDELSAKSSGLDWIKEIGAPAGVTYYSKLFGKHLSVLTDLDEVILLPSGRKLDTMRNKVSGAYSVMVDIKAKASTLKVDLSGHNHMLFVRHNLILSRIDNIVRSSLTEKGRNSYTMKVAEIFQVAGVKDKDLVACFEEAAKPENQKTPDDEFRQSAQVLGVSWALNMKSVDTHDGAYAPMDGTPDFEERYPLISMIQPYTVASTTGGYARIVSYLNDCYEQLTEADEN